MKKAPQSSRLRGFFFILRLFQASVSALVLATSVLVDWPLLQEVPEDRQGAYLLLVLLL